MAEPIVLELTREELERLLDWAYWKEHVWIDADRELVDRLMRLLLKAPPT